MQPVQPSSDELSQLFALSRAGQHAELERRARLLTGQYPAFGAVWKLLGESLYMQGKDALEALRVAAELLPNDNDVFNNLAIALTAAGRYEDAILRCKQALKIKPDDARAFNNLGIAQSALGMLDAAVTSYREALRINPNYDKAHNNLGLALREIGRGEEAEQSYRRALEINPNYVVALVGAAYICVEKGELEEAAALGRKALSIKPDDLDARLLFPQVGKVKAGDENLAALLKVHNAYQKGNVLKPESAIRLNFTIGKCLDDLGDYDRAFPYFMEGSRLKCATFTYDDAAVKRYFSGIMQTFDQETIERLQIDESSDLPIFVLGMPRSGTTLTEQIVAGHPEVYGAGELHELIMITNRDPAANFSAYPKNLSALDQAIVAKWRTEYLSSLRRRAPKAKRITDKMPSNFFFIGLIHAMLPNAKIIHVAREPADNCLSCFIQLFHSQHEFTYDLTTLGNYYVEYAKLMDHWRSVLPAGSFLEVQYEDIVADQEHQARRILDFCGLDWDDACLRFQQNKRFVRTASMTQVRQPLYSSSVKRWRNYEKFLGPLFEALGALSPDRR